MIDCEHDESPKVLQESDDGIQISTGLLDFESIEDHDGHGGNVSPWALRTSARCTENELKSNRYGGDAFLLLVPGKADHGVSEMSCLQTQSQ